MALTIGEASDVNTLLCYVLGERDPYVRRTDAEWHEEAGAAAARLAGKAYKQLSAGLTDTAVRDQWTCVELGPWKDQPATREEQGR